MDKFIKAEAFKLVEDEGSNITYLSKLGDNYLDLSNTDHKNTYKFIESKYTKKNSLYFSPSRDSVLRLVPIGSMPSNLTCMDEDEPEI